MKFILVICLFYTCVKLSEAWDSDQLEVFDAVDEIKQNFYALLNVTQEATDKEIKQAFRSLTLKLHPDKNLEVDTSEQFRNLVSVYDILRNPTKRKYYNDVLVNGLPNWRSAVYYYRYVRKMGMTEACVILFIIVTIGQYLVYWGAYLEKMYTIEQNRKRKSRKDRHEVVIEIPKPSFKDTLPVQIPCLIWSTIGALPQNYKYLKVTIQQQVEEMRRRRRQSVEEQAAAEMPRSKTVRKRNKGFVVPEGPNFTSTNAQSSHSGSASRPTQPAMVSGGLWTDDDLAELVRLVKKHPGGTPKRWEVIAEALCRSVPEVTFMANKMKENAYKVPSEQTDEETAALQPKVKQKTKKAEVDDSHVKNWTQVQQRALEDALAKYTKGCNDRWDRIAEAVPNKTKEECMQRFRYLAGSLRKQKEGTDTPKDDSTAVDQNEE